MLLEILGLFSLLGGIKTDRKKPSRQDFRSIIARLDSDEKRQLRKEIESTLLNVPEHLRSRIASENKFFSDLHKILEELKK